MSAKAEDLAFDPYKADRHRVELLQSLEEAKPVMEEALAALEVLSKRDMTDIARMKSPTAVVKDVVIAVSMLLDESGRFPSTDWETAKKEMTNASVFLTRLQNFDKDRLTGSKVAVRIINFIEKKFSDLNADIVRKSSTAAASLFLFAQAMCKYVRTAQRYDPMRAELAQMENPVEESLLAWRPNPMYAL